MERVLVGKHAEENNHVIAVKGRHQDEASASDTSSDDDEDVLVVHLSKFRRQNLDGAPTAITPAQETSPDSRVQSALAGRKSPDEASDVEKRISQTSTGANPDLPDQEKRESLRGDETKSPHGDAGSPRRARPYHNALGFKFITPPQQSNSMTMSDHEAQRMPEDLEPAGSKRVVPVSDAAPERIMAERDVAIVNPPISAGKLSPKELSAHVRSSPNQQPEQQAVHSQLPMETETERSSSQAFTRDRIDAAGGFQSASMEQASHECLDGVAQIRHTDSGSFEEEIAPSQKLALQEDCAEDRPVFDHMGSNGISADDTMKIEAKGTQSGILDVPDLLKASSQHVDLSKVDADINNEIIPDSDEE